MKFKSCWSIFFSGVYLACLLYNGDKVLVTSDDMLPIVEVDENFSGPNVYGDFHWLMKVSCNWDDVKSLRQDLDKNTSAGAMHFRSKLLQAVSIMQVWKREYRFSSMKSSILPVLTQILNFFFNFYLFNIT